LTGTFNSLKSCLNEAMVQLYLMQTAVINSNDLAAKQKQMFLAIREPMQRVCQGSVAVMRQIYTFIADAELIKANALTAKRDEILPILRDTKELCSQISKSTEQLHGALAQVKEPYNRNVESLKRSLSKAAARPAPANITTGGNGGTILAILYSINQLDRLSIHRPIK
jgi:hypothetical protein